MPYFFPCPPIQDPSGANSRIEPFYRAWPCAILNFPLPSVVSTGVSDAECCGMGNGRLGMSKGEWQYHVLPSFASGSGETKDQT